MIGLGAALAAVAVAALMVAIRPVSGVARRLDRVAPHARGGGVLRWRAVPDMQLRHAGLHLDPDRLFGLKIACALCGALAAALVGLLAPTGALVVVAAAYAGFIAPTAMVERRAGERRAAAEREVAVLVERLEALVAAGRPPETALALLARRPTGAVILDDVLRRTAQAYALGAPLFRTLAAHARAEGLAACAAVADDLERARDLGAGSMPVIHERRASLRGAQRARSLEAAAQVEGKLMLILVLCYLPALVLLVVVPLFVGLLEGIRL